MGPRGVPHFRGALILTWVLEVSGTLILNWVLEVSHIQEYFNIELGPSTLILNWGPRGVPHFRGALILNWVLEVSHISGVLQY